MALPSLHITNGPSVRAVELAFVARDVGAMATFTVFIPDLGPYELSFRIFNFQYVTCHGPNYKLGGRLFGVRSEHAEKLPPSNWVYVQYDAEKKQGTMEFSNAE